jgi:hypothetical protein
MAPVEGALLRVWRRSRGWDVADTARRLRHAADGEHMPNHDSLVRQIRGWERGDHEISERYEMLYARALGISHPELAAGPSPGLAVVEAGAVSGLAGSQLDTEQHGAMPDWPGWFGLKLAQLITMTDNWQSPSGLGTLQTLLNEEILMSDAAVPGDARHLRLLHDVSRRQALMTLGALPMAMPGARLAAPAFDTGDDLFLSRCAASITACWHLLKGSDLAGVEQLLTGYLLPLEAAALRPSRHRRAAATLAAQAHRVCGIISLHRNQLRVREQHCQRALLLAEIACDPSGHAAALISLASTYFYAGEPEAAAGVYEQVFQHGSALPQLQRCRVHAELSVVYGQLGREQESVRANAQAEALYPERPEQDPSFLYAEFTPASLTLERGLGFVALAERFPGRGYERQAARIFQLGTAPDLATPDRIRLEIVNHQARTAVLHSDLDAFEAFMHQGLDGVTLLASRQRIREMRTTLRHARARWPAERRITMLGERVSKVTVAGELA